MLKYIVTTCLENGEEIFVFPETISHRAMSEMVMFARQTDWDFGEVPVRETIAAGFVSRGTCYGRSESLNLDSRGELDTNLLG